jgi:hypothetical protein
VPLFAFAVLACSHWPMNSAKKKCMVAGGALGIAFPVIIIFIGRYGGGLGADIPDLVFEPLVPLIFVAYVLGQVGVPATIVWAIVLFLNVALYAGLGWLSWWIVKRLRGQSAM